MAAVPAIAEDENDTQPSAEPSSPSLEDAAFRPKRVASGVGG
jgi:hypothetical protein